jgi:hypothetical protein
LGYPTQTHRQKILVPRLRPSTRRRELRGICNSFAFFF